jgi:zinc D-Ala-D-Ala carboxypeptidase
MQLSAHFSLAELTVTGTGVDNTPDDAMIANLTILAEFGEKVRAALDNNPVYVDSAYRNPKVNEAIGGVPNDAHEKGDAMDIRCPGYGTPYEVAQRLVKAHEEGLIDYDQLIYEQTWVHISRDPQLREMNLTLVPADGSYLDGIVGP